MPRRRSTEDIQLLRGALFVLRRKCGKPTCRLARAQGESAKVHSDRLRLFSRKIVPGSA